MSTMPRHRLSVIAIGMLLALAATTFTWRALLSHPGREDYILVYCAARAWVLGENPYDLKAIERVWTQAGGPAGRSPMKREYPHLIYPPTTLAMLAPFGALPWSLSEPVWAAANIGFLAMTVWAICRLAGFSAVQRRTWVFVSLCLLFAPVHTAFRHGQTPLYPMALIAMGLLWTRHRVGWPSGLWQAAATLIKPQMGLPFLALEFVRGRMKAVLAGTALMAVASVVALVPLHRSGIDWWARWKENLSGVGQARGQGDPTQAYPLRFQMINLHVPLHSFTDDRTLVNVLVAVIVCGLAAVFFYWPPRRWRLIDPPILLSSSMVAVLSLMFVYHRFYDAVLLMLPLAWAVGRLAVRPRDRVAWAALALLTPFALNSSTAMYWLKEAGRVPGRLHQSAAWDVLVIPHQGWALLILALLLTIARLRTTREVDAFNANAP